MPGLVAVRIQAGSVRKALAPTVERLRNAEPVMKKTVGLIRASVANEFLQRTWFEPNGSRRPWAPNVPFGDRTGPGGSEKKPLIESGAYFRALVQGGPGGYARVTGLTATVGVEIASFPYAPFIRGGVGANIRLSPLIIKPIKRAAGGAKSGPQQYALWWYLGLTFGVWLTMEKLKEGIKLPPRPHLTSNPVLVGQIARLYERFLETGHV